MLRLKNYILLISILVLFLAFSLPIVYSEEDVNLLFQKGIELWENNNLNEAISYFDKVLEIEPNHVGALNNKGGVLSVLGNQEEAISYFDKVLEIEPNDIDAITNKGSVLGSLGEFDEAILYFDKALEIDQNHTDALFNKANVLIDQEKYYEAIPYYLKMLRVDPSNQIAKAFHILTKNSLEYKKVDGFVEFIVHDSHGKLVGYFKKPYISVLDHEVGWDFIDTWTVVREFSYEDKDYEVLQRIYTGEILVDTVAATVVIYNFEQPDIWLVRTQTWGFPLNEGDKITKLYTIFREVQ